MIHVIHPPSSSPDAATRARDLAWAEAFAGLARVSATLSTRLRQIHAESTDAAGSSGEEPSALERPRPAPGRARQPKGGFGPRQQTLLALGGLDLPEGLSAPEVAASLGWARSNAHGVMTRLEELGALHRLPDERPARWTRAVD